MSPPAITAHRSAFKDLDMRFLSLRAMRNYHRDASFTMATRFHEAHRCMSKPALQMRERARIVPDNRSWQFGTDRRDKLVRQMPGIPFEGEGFRVTDATGRLRGC